MSATDLEYFLGQLSRFRGVVSRAMFGGYGLYQDGIFFGLVDRSGILYFHTDDASRAAYEAAGSSPFEMGSTSKKPARYWEVPSEIVEAPARLAEWAELACETAREKKRPKKSKKRRAKAQAGMSASAPVQGPGDRISSLRNLGPVTERWLKKVGVETRGDLEELGSLACYLAVIKAGWRPNRNLLFALEGALLDVDCRKLPPPIKDSLDERLERLETKS